CTGCTSWSTTLGASITRRYAGRKAWRPNSWPGPLTISASTSPRRAHPVLCMAWSMASKGAPAGHVDLDASSYWGCWTHLGPSNRYIERGAAGEPHSCFSKLHPWRRQQCQWTRLRGFDRGRLPNRAGAVADIQAADPGDLATRLVRQYVGSVLDH